MGKLWTRIGIRHLPAGIVSEGFTGSGRVQGVFFFLQTGTLDSSGTRVGAHAALWTNIAQVGPTRLELPTDFPTGSSRGEDGSRGVGALAGELPDFIRRVSHESEENPRALQRQAEAGKIC